MDIIGIGTDIVECVRIRRMIDKHGELFLARVFTEQEIAACHSRKRSTEHFAAHWAAKQAVLKCLSTGLVKGICLTEIEVRNDPKGQAKIALYGATRELAQNQQITEILISISHCRLYAIAYATAVCHVGEEE
jgi:holo-[acyl-carrier protein] synthase